MIIPRAAAAAAAVITWAVPSLYRPVPGFQMTAGGKDVGLIDNHDYYHGTFMMNAATEIIITVEDPKVKIASISVSPLKKNIVGKIEGNKVKFTLPTDGYYIATINDIKPFVILADPFEGYVPPTEGKGYYNVIKDYGANNKGDGYATKAIQDAIDHASGNFTRLRDEGFPGPHTVVYVPPGVYLSGNIVLKSNVALYMAPGSVFRMNDKREDYQMHYRKDSQGRDVTYFIRTEWGSENIKVFGRGIVDGNGMAVFKNEFSNSLMVPIKTKGFYLDGVSFRNSGSWCVTPIYSQNVYMKNVKVLNRKDMGENDGFDVMHSQNVLIKRSIGIGLDDPYSTKTWPPNKGTTKNWPQDAFVPLKDVTFDDCLAWTFCFGFKVGNGVFEDQKNVTFKNSVVYNASGAISVAYAFGNKTASDITFENIDIERTTEVHGSFSSWQAMTISGDDKLGVGHVENVLVKDIRVRTPGKKESVIWGHSKTANFRGITYQNIMMPGADKPALTLKDLNITGEVKFAENVVVKA